jgi:hypothetical protein
MTSEDIAAPAIYQGTMNNGAHAEYSEESAPSHTGDQ